MCQLNKTLTASILLAALAILWTLWVVSPLVIATASTGVSLPQANEDLVHAAFEQVLNNGRLAAADAIFAANYRQHTPNLPVVTLGAEGVKLLASLYRTAFFNLRYTIDDVVAAGDKVVIRWTASGRHIRPFGLYPPSGQQVTWTGMTIYRMANGQIVEAWTNRDDLTFLKQLGATTLTGATWGPAYDADGLLVIVTNPDDPDAVAASGAITWGPSYYADDTNVEVGRHRPELDFMRQVDQQVLSQKTWGPAYYR